MKNQALLETRLDRALVAAGGQPLGAALLADLMGRYQQPQRHYHTLAHIEACLAWLDWHAAQAESACEVELALWYHDAVYDPMAGDNEEQSAALAKRALSGAGLADELGERIVSHILATKTHEAKSNDARLLVDVDLTILGAKPAVFAEFERQIRLEYSHVPAELFREGRSEVLTRFLSRKEIYRTRPLRDQLEATARRNLEQRLAQLAQES